MRAKSIASTLALVAAVCLALCGTSSAAGRPASRASKPKVTAALQVRGSNGFAVTVSLVDRRKLTLSALSLRGGIFSTNSVSYAMRIHPRRGSDRLTASFGKLGRLDMRFVRESTEETPPLLKICTGGKTVTEIGHYVGYFAFRGEHGFTRVRVHSAPGTITREPAQTCDFSKLGGGEGKKKHHKRHKKPNKGKGEEEAEIQSVQLLAISPARRIAFLASRLAIKSKHETFALLNFIAAGTRHRGRITETSTAFVLFETGPGFKVQDSELPTRGALLAPPFPFTGSATYARESPEKVSWSGDLAVELPGFGEVRLAAPDFHASMCQAGGCKFSSPFARRIPAFARRAAHLRAAHL